MASKFPEFHNISSTLILNTFAPAPQGCVFSALFYSLYIHAKDNTKLTFVHQLCYCCLVDQQQWRDEAQEGDHKFCALVSEQ